MSDEPRRAMGRRAARRERRRHRVPVGYRPRRRDVTEDERWAEALDDIRELFGSPADPVQWRVAS